MRGMVVLVLLLYASFARADEASVLYVTGSTYYVGAGLTQGVQTGNVLEVVRDGVVVAKLVVQHVASERSACDLLEGAITVEVGDVVRYEASPMPAPVVDASRTIAPVVSTRGGTWRDYGIRGRVGVRQYALIDRTNLGSDYVRPSLDLRLDGNRLGGSDFDVEADVRAHRSFGRDDDGRARVYRLLARWQPASWSFILGRQTSAALPNTGIFDGLTAEIAGPAWALGAISGTQPDLISFGLASDIWEHGLYTRVRGLAWSSVLGVVGSYESGEVNREYVYVGGHFHRGSWSGSLRQEVDVYRQWRADMESSTLSPTSTYAQLNGHVGSTSLGAGFDNRRAVRLYRTRETPETAFDDSYRQGVWGRATFRAGSARVAVEARTHRGAASGSADSGTLAVRRLPLGGLRAHTRVTFYRNDLLQGVLASLGVDARVNDRLTARAYGGERFEEVRGNAFGDGSGWWLGLDAELTVGAGWLVAGSFEHVAGGNDARETFYSGVSYRF